ncbi:MAG: hypothetical protein K9W46_03970 [Candidatus Heimdallarchaeum endolithica]|uniref:Uncharacterized protein n=1 Tax=Candidatus Heimdallarchaeum endolithica TaxID=2876572 RepID=A0A9Y1BSV3_9ARCH|nr:MAG: hypothetical protein K9W46_03970 [Candidatus Heimdallarchaeum endolithica]
MVGIHILKTNKEIMRKHYVFFIKFIKDFVNQNKFYKLLFIISFFLLSSLPGMVLYLPNADDPKGHAIQALLMFDQKALFPSWTEVISYGFYLKEKLYYPPLSYCFLLWFYSFFTIFNLNMGIFFNNFLRFTFFILFIFTQLLYKIYFEEAMIEINISLLFLTFHFSNLPKWGGFPFIFSLIILIFSISILFEINANPIKKNHFLFLVTSFVLLLSHFNSFGFLLQGVFILSFYRLFSLKEKKYYWSMIVLIFGFIYLETAIYNLKFHLYVILSKKGYLGIYDFLYSPSSWTQTLWNYIRRGQTGQSGLFSTSSKVFNLFQYYFSFFYFPFIFALFFLFCHFLDKNLNLQQYLVEVNLLFLFSLLILTLFQIQIFAGNFIRFPLSAYLFRIERSYVILNCIIVPILSGYFINKKIINFNEIKKFSEITMKQNKNIKLKKFLKKIKKSYIIYKLKILTIILIIVMSFAVNMYIIVSRTTISYNEETLIAYNWIKNYNGSMVILNDQYAQFLPLFVYSSNKTICYPFYSSRDLIYTENLVFSLFYFILNNENDTQCLQLLNSFNITHIFVSDDKPNYIAEKLANNGTIYSNQKFNSMNFLITVFSLKTVSIYEVNYSLIWSK